VERKKNGEYKIKLKNLEVKEYNSIIVGSGAAGLNCALHLIMEGIPANDIAIVTDNLGGGTSFNAGSDKQTYYKMSIYGDQQDSPYQLAQDLCVAGAMHGDIALIEATNSLREFFHLVQLGVPFPFDDYGGFVGYKTDNDPRQRATSAGPLTSQEMGKCLLNAVKEAKIPILDKHYAIKILVDNTEKRNKAIGVICIKTDELSIKKNLDNFIKSIRLFQARNVIIATGGPAILYKHSAYPNSQKGSIGLAIIAGCKLQNLTESQFGLASTKFKWNLSGSYQQVIPRYLSIDKQGNENEFLRPYFHSFQQLSNAIFLKGYQWPFNAERIEDSGSSLIDLAVYYETEILGNNVYLDYTRNPGEYNEEELDPKVREYLDNSNALAPTPITRLKKLNPNAIELYHMHGIDITKNPLRIAICNQHLNGGITGDIWWETNIKNLFAIGEVNGSHGVHRPGGSALNAGQVGGLRAAQKIGREYWDTQSLKDKYFLEHTGKDLLHILNSVKIALSKNKNDHKEFLTPFQILEQIHERMSKYGGILRPLEGLFEVKKELIFQITNLDSLIQLKNNQEIIDYFHIKDALITQQFFIEAILNYHKSRGNSRGSFLILRDKLDDTINERYLIPPGDLAHFKFIVSDIDLKDKIQTIQSQNGTIKIEWEKIRTIPKEFGWFENVWKSFSKK